MVLQAVSGQLNINEEVQYPEHNRTCALLESGI